MVTKEWGGRKDSSAAIYITKQSGLSSINFTLFTTWGKVCSGTTRLNIVKTNAAVLPVPD